MKNNQLVMGTRNHVRFWLGVKSYCMTANTGVWRGVLVT
jgi:hypothetical protein